MLISLSGKWTLSDGKHKITGNVPGDITNDAYLAGLIRDPYYGDNCKECLWITQTDWTYEREFLLDELPPANEHAFLRFYGIDTYADVFLNGVKIGSAESMQRAYEFPADGALKKGKNTVAVCLSNIFDKIGREEQTKYGSIFHKNRIFARKAQCHFGWDWAPQFPGYGIYRGVELVSEPVCALKEVNIRTYVSGDVTFRLLFGKKFDGDLSITVTRNGRAAARFEGRVNCKKLICNLHTENPDLWWPNGYGEQALYDYEIVQKKDGLTVFTKKGYFGFREVGLDKCVLDEKTIGFGFNINGRTVFCRGSNWVPAECMTGRLTDDKYYALVRAAKDANMNMLRVWGGGIYESDVFYEFCDRMGIMIWQDFMFACSEIPEDNAEFMGKLLEETVQQVKRLKNHPCLTYWCGMNEISGSFNEAEEKYSRVTLHYLFRGIVGEFSEEIPYGYASPYAFGDIENDPSEGDVHANITEPCLFNASFKGFEEYDYGRQTSVSETADRICRYDECLGGTEGNFSSECAVLGACNYSSLLKFTPARELDLRSSFFTRRFLGNPYTYVMPTFYERQKLLASAMYGPLKDVCDFLKKANKAQADIMKSEIVYARSGERSHGMLTWMYNDIWPTGTWSVVDYFLAKKPAYYVMKRCFEPFMAEVIKIKGSYYLCVANDTPHVVGTECAIGLFDYSGERLQQERVKIALPVGGRLQHKLGFPGGAVGYISFGLEIGGKRRKGICWAGCYGKQAYVPEYEAVVSETAEGALVTVNAKTFVPCFTVFAPESAVLSDNCNDIAAGEQKDFLVYGAKKTEISFASFCEDWER